MWSITSMLFLALVMISNGPHTHYTTHWQPTKKGNKRLYGEPPLFADSTKGLNKSFVERTAFVCWMETPFEKLTKRLERCNSSPASSIDERGLHLFKTFIFFCYNRPLWYAQQKLLQYSSLLLQKKKWWEPQPAKITRRNQLSQRKLKASAIFFQTFLFSHCAVFSWGHPTFKSQTHGASNFPLGSMPPRSVNLRGFPGLSCCVVRLRGGKGQRFVRHGTKLQLKARNARSASRRMRHEKVAVWISANIWRCNLTCLFFISQFKVRLIWSKSLLWK